MENSNIVLITGCSGRIGTKLAEKLKREFQVIGLDVVAPHNPSFFADFVYTDLSSDKNVQNALTQISQKYGTNIASVVHLAAYYSFSGEPSEKYDTITVEGTGRLLRNLKNLQCGQFIFSSTMLIHAPCKVGDKITEESPIVATWDYPISKIKTEKLIRMEHGSIPTVVLRIAGVYDDYCNSIPLSQQIVRIFEKQPIAHLFPGNLRHGANFIHNDDLIDALYLCIKKRNELPKETTMLIGEPATSCYDTLQRTISKCLHGKEITTHTIPKIMAKCGAGMMNLMPGSTSFVKPWMIDLADQNYELDISLAQNLLGWNPKHTVLDAIPNMCKALTNNPIEWYKQHQLPVPKNLEKLTLSRT